MRLAAPGQIDEDQGMREYGALLCSFSFATTRWHLRFSPVYDVFLYDRAIAVVLTSSKPEFADAVRRGRQGHRLQSIDARRRQRMLRKAAIPPERLLEQDQGNRLILWSEVTGGRLHARRLGIARLVLSLNDDDALKLIWVPRGPITKMNPPMGAVADVLRQVLGARITID